MPNQEELLRAWVYARIPGDCAATRASYDACCRQAGDDGCTVVGGSIDYKGHGPLAAIQVGKKNRSIRPTHRRSVAVVRLKFYYGESEGDTVW